ncbi:MAG: 5-(carboxyamino)imidazole ribonucleotide synthase [Chitinivibrionales bacterium]|nr:5-(carboxyamino)imidazole ribonucleotide synthase [Chitinivibrionales bacterium]MBD3358504.1 5-(carboxyamino)imidazole ribonucleotide synthase [Chitinivibrionales bacterium]
MEETAGIGHTTSVTSRLFRGEVRLGIIQGGQLGRMLLQPCMNFGITPYVMDKDPSAPCREFCEHFFRGDARSREDVYEFGKRLDMLTLEYEDVNLEALVQLEKDGVRVHPSPAVIKTIQDKGLQKTFFHENGIPTSEFVLLNTADELSRHKSFLPAYQKLRKSGYDGKGVKKLVSDADLKNGFDEPSLLERSVPIEKEIAVIVARNVSGRMETFPVVEMVFHPGANMLDYLFAPAELDDAVRDRAVRTARTIARQMEVVGILAVEMFVTPRAEVLVNELAPRPHNSGHHTIEANMTSQFEQHLRAILDLPLGSPDMRSPAVMVNLIGADGAAGPVRYDGLEEVLARPGVYIHRYGKKICRPFRKMGHVTVINDDIGEAKRIAAEVKQTVRVGV